MNTIRNDKMIKRYSRIGQVTMILSLVILIGGMIFSLRSQNQLGFTISLVALAVGFIMSQVSFFLGNRFGRSPRPDELINQALKGLDSKYCLYHYTTPVSHLLVGPAGIWIFLTYHQRGKITYSGGRWRQKGGNLYLKIFAQDNIGRPDLDLISEKARLVKFLKNHLDESAIPPIQGALVFTNPKVEINIPETENPPAETVYIRDLKEMIRKAAKTKQLAPEKVKLVQDILSASQR